MKRFQFHDRADGRLVIAIRAEDEDEARRQFHLRMPGFWKRPADVEVREQTAVAYWVC